MGSLPPLAITGTGGSLHGCWHQVETPEELQEGAVTFPRRVPILSWQLVLASLMTTGTSKSNPHIGRSVNILHLVLRGTQHYKVKNSENLSKT